jgi:hypothetical protein
MNIDHTEGTWEWISEKGSLFMAVRILMQLPCQPDFGKEILKLDLIYNTGQD